MSKSKSFFPRSLSSHLTATLIAVTTIALLFLTLVYYALSKNTILNIAQTNLEQLLQEGTKQLDTYIRNIEDGMKNIVLDKDLYNVIKKGATQDEYELYIRDTIIKQKLRQHFAYNIGTVSYPFITDYFIYGDTSELYQPLEETLNSKLYQKAREGMGSTVYIPSFAYSDMFSQSENLQFPYSKMFAVVKQINLMLFQERSPVPLPQEVVPPVLAVYIDESTFNQFFENLLEYNQAQVYLLDEQGRVFFSTSGLTHLPASSETAFIDEISGENTATYMDQKYLLKGGLSRQTGWKVVGSCQMNLLLKPVEKTFLYSLAILSALVLMMALVAVLISRRIVKPVKLLKAAIGENIKGDFSMKIPEKGTSETIALAEAYNHMNDEIQGLIEKNIQAGMREKDLHLMTLQMQLEPHFLYNTLNTVNWMAINEGSSDISLAVTKLSRMLRYTMEAKKELTPFSADWAWMENYLDLMKYRMDERIAFYHKIDPELQQVLVPLLFLQPFVENAVIHGLDHMEEGGYIEIRGELLNGICCFSVADNGKGISTEQIERIFSKDKDIQRIGIKNVDHRVKLIFGEKYGVQIHSGVIGTNIQIVFPAVYDQTNKNNKAND